MSWNDLRKGRYSQYNGEYFITFNTYNKQPFFYNFKHSCQFARHIAINEVDCNCTWLSWVLMPDHFHGLLHLTSNDLTLSQVVGNLKGKTAFAINKTCDQRGAFWQPSFYDRALRADDDRKNIARYIVANPLRKGIVDDIKNYPFWNSIYL